MIDIDLLDFYNKILGSEKEKKIVKMLEAGIDNEEILKLILEESRDEKND